MKCKARALTSRGGYKIRPRQVRLAAGMLAFGLALAAPLPLPAQSSETSAFIAGEDDELIHQASGARFPLKIAGFLRNDTAVVAPHGEYIGVEYTRPLSIDGAITVRAAVVRMPGLSPEAHYVITQPVVMRTLSDARRVAEGPYERVEGSPGYRGVFTGSSGGRSWMRGLWTFKRGDWDWRVRADFPRIDLVQADEAIEQFVDALSDIHRAAETTPSRSN